MGRPLAKIDPVELSKICVFHITDEEIANHFGVSQKTIQHRKADTKTKYKIPVIGEPKGTFFTGTFAEIMDHGKQRGKTSLRRLLWAQAQQLGSRSAVAAAIFLAKNVLGYRDSQHTEVTGKDGGPIEVKTISLSKFNTAQLLALTEIGEAAEQQVLEEQERRRAESESKESGE